MEITNSISQIFACKSLHTIFNKIYVVHIASRCCGELCAENRSILNLQSYDNWLISLAEKMHKPHAAARNCSSGTMLLIDIDHFKYFNDQYGHATGDFVLKFLGKALQGLFSSHYNQHRRRNRRPGNDNRCFI